MPVSHHLVFTGRMPFLLPDQQHQSTESNKLWKKLIKKKLSVHAHTIHNTTCSVSYQIWQTLLFRCIWCWIWCRDNNLLLAAATKQQSPDGLVERMTDQSIEHVSIIQCQSITQPTDVHSYQRFTQQNVQFWQVAVTTSVHQCSKCRHTYTIIRQCSHYNLLTTDLFISTSSCSELLVRTAKLHWVLCYMSTLMILSIYCSHVLAAGYVNFNSKTSSKSRPF